MHANIKSQGTSSMFDAVTMNRTARIAAALYVIIIVAGIFAQFAVRESLIVAGDPTETAANILADEGLFRASIAADLAMIASDVGIAVAFFVLLRPISPILALAAAFFRLAQAFVLAVNLLNLSFAVNLIRGTDGLDAMGTQASNAQALMFLNAHGYGYSLALIFFGISILVVGYLVFRSGYLPRWLGVITMIAAFGYLIDSSAHLLLANYADYEGVLGAAVGTAFIAEPAMALWLLFKGVKVPKSDSNITLNTAQATATA